VKWWGGSNPERRIGSLIPSVIRDAPAGEGTGGGGSQRNKGDEAEAGRTTEEYSDRV
jgi:hypothetical protein